MVVWGVVVSTLKDRLAGVGSVFFAWSVALTSSECGPSVREPVLNGELQAANAPSSMRHSNVPLGSLDANVKEGVFVAVEPEGPRRCSCREASCREATPSSSQSR
jgi:hypothetical protein